ncbi:MAG TPA: ATP-binding protein [Kofleriaceae bacterium]|nr:ATP-binding protein [Kofleriaceae bacterium]
MRPDPKRTQLEYEYKTALRDAVSGAGEVALAHAYELGRVAAAGGVGVVDLVSIHQTALKEVLGDDAPPPEVGQFVTEALSPFEMTHRGFREAHERLEAAYRELEAFSYSVSHDLRAPLRTISAFTQALAEDLKFQLDDKARDHLRRVLAAAARMSDLIDALLELSQITRTQLGRHRIDLSQMAQGIIEDLRRRDVTRKLSADIKPDLVIDADARLMRIALENLIGNAWKFTANVERPKVTIGVQQIGGERVFFVRDNGAGFDMEHADRLFTPFQRLHASRDYAGTGIGLATVRRIIDRHGGRIWAEAAPGQGATFFFTLPA